MANGFKRPKGNPNQRQSNPKSPKSRQNLAERKQLGVDGSNSPVQLADENKQDFLPEDGIISAKELRDSLDL